MPNNREIEVRVVGQGVGRARVMDIEAQAIQAAEAQRDNWLEQILAPVRPVEIQRLEPIIVDWGIGKHMRTYSNKPEMHGLELFDTILNNFKEIYDVDFVIAGGAVRDLYMKCSETSPDVDVFIPMKYEEFMERFNELGWPGAVVKVPVQPYNKGKDWDNSVRASYKFKGMPLDLVFIKSPLTPAMVQSFPIHAQRCVYTLEGGISISPEAMLDLSAKKFTISPTITDKEYIKNLQGKITQWKQRPAYKNFKAVLPRCTEWWMKVNSDHNTKGKVK